MVIETEQCFKSNGICILIYTVYFVFLLYQYIIVLPVKCKIDQHCLDTQIISKEQVEDKIGYINSIGLYMIGSNLLTILIVSFVSIKTRGIYYGISEVFLYNLIIWIFILKNARMWIAYTVFAVLIIKYYWKLPTLKIRIDLDRYHLVNQRLNNHMVNYDKLSARIWRELHQANKIIKEKKQMLRKILQLFPSGIIFYSEVEGIFYKNKFWLDLVSKYRARVRLGILEEQAARQ